MNDTPYNPAAETNGNPQAEADRRRIEELERQVEELRRELDCVRLERNDYTRLSSS